jgi:hypothetical protein
MNCGSDNPAIYKETRGSTQPQQLSTQQSNHRPFRCSLACAGVEFKAAHADAVLHESRYSNVNFYLSYATLQTQEFEIGQMPAIKVGG